MSKTAKTPYKSNTKKPLAWSAFRQSVLPELDTIYTIKELLRVKFGFMFLPFFDAEQVDCLLADLCTG